MPAPIDPARAEATPLARAAKPPIVLPGASLGVMAGLTGTALLLVMLALAYLIKSAAGVDLLPGPSPLHDLLYPLLGRG